MEALGRRKKNILGKIKTYVLGWEVTISIIIEIHHSRNESPLIIINKGLMGSIIGVGEKLMELLLEILIWKQS